VFKAAYWHTDRLYLFFSRGHVPDQIHVEIRPKQDIAQEALEAVARDFCNAIIDYQVRQEVIAETGEIRDTLLRKAFGEGRRHLKPENLVSDESHLTGDGQSYQDDPRDIGRLTGSEKADARRARD
jgi:His-Xaa-Ser system protein HxsD